MVSQQHILSEKPRLSDSSLLHCKTVFLQTPGVRKEPYAMKHEKAELLEQDIENGTGMKFEF
jgi:hypothetical protein